MTRPPTQDRPAVPIPDTRRDGGRSGVSRFSIDIRRHYGTVEISVGGDLDALGCELLAGALSDLVDGQGNLDVIVDLGAVTHIEPPALQVVAAAADASAKRGGRLRLTATMDAALMSAGLGGLLIAPRRPSTDSSNNSKISPLPAASGATSQISAAVHQVLPAQVP
jgi:anti-anti-sigma factor